MRVRSGFTLLAAGSLQLGMGLPTALPAADAVGAPPPIEQDVATQLRGLNDALQAARLGAWAGYSETVAYGRDARGRTAGEDINEWLMSRDSAAQLQTLREEAESAHQAGNDPDARSKIEAAWTLLRHQGQIAYLIGYYWEQKIAADRQRELWQRWLAQVPASVAAESRARVAPLEAAVAQVLSPTAVPQALNDTTRALLDMLNQERGRLAGQVSEQRIADGVPGSVRERTTPCTPAAAAGDAAAEDRPLSVVSRPNVADFYPQEARKASISGRVLVRLSIGEDGCMRRAEVIRSSGVPELDDAALDLPQYMTFLPPIEHGRPVATRTTLPVNFALYEDASAAAAAATAGEAAAEHVRRGHELVGQQKFDEAIEQFEQAIAADPKYAMAYAERGMALVMQRKPELAQQDFDRAASIDPQNWVVSEGRGLLAFQTGHYAEAVAQFTSAIQVKPGDPYSLGWRTEARMYGGDLTGALADADLMIQSTPGNYGAYSLKALVLRLQGKPEVAFALAQELIRDQGAPAGAFGTAAGIYAALGRQADALRAISRSLELAANARGFLTRASYREKADIASRTADVQAALTLDPQSIAAATALARLQADAGAVQDAIATLNAALERHPDQLDLLVARGVTYTRSQQPDLAERDFVAARAAASSSIAHNSVCWALATAGVALDQALSECDAAVAESPEDGAILDSRGFVLLRLGRYQEAIRSYDAALVRRPMSADSLYGRGLARQGAGEQAAAAADLRAATTINAAVRREFAAYGL